MKHWIIKYRLLIIVISLSMTFMAMLQLPRIEVNPDLNNYVPEQITNKQHLKKLDSIFGGSEIIMMLLQTEDVINNNTLKRIQTLTEEFQQIEGLNRCLSPFDLQDVYTDEGFMVIEPLLETIPTDKNGYNHLKSKISENKMASRFFVDDYSTVAIMLIKDPKYSDKLIIDNIKQIISDNPGEEEVLLGGYPFIRYSISGNIKKDLIYLLPLALFLMVFMLYSSFREWKGVFFPFLIVIMSMTLAFGVMVLLGWKMSLITILLPIMLISIANNYGIHMIAHYQELATLDSSKSMAKICKQIYQDLKRPIIITCLTTIGGILGLLTHTMIPAAQLGILAAVGIAFSLFLSIWFLPALLSYFKPVPTTQNARRTKLALPDRMLKQFSKTVCFNPKRILILSSIAAIIGTTGLLFLRVDTNIERYFLGKSEVRQSIKLINEKFGGTQFISIYFKGDVLSPELLKRMENYEEILSKDPTIGTISSPVSLLKELSKGFYTKNEPEYGQLPSSADEAYQLIELYSMTGDEEALYQFMDYNYENSRIIVSLKDGSNKEGKRVNKLLNSITKDDPDVEFIAGPALTTIQLADLVVNGQIKSLLLAIAVVFILLSLIFRSVRAGIVSAVPLAIAIVVLFGMMGFFYIAIDIATALLSSIMIGVGIDYTIHFIWRFKKELAKGVSHIEAVDKTLTTTGRGIIFNALSVIIGFMALTVSNFAPLRFFGILVVISITSCLLSALMVIPSIFILIKPKFLNQKQEL